ncbi:unnamed protein product [Psylliodes chrysocephalus]|uniref:Uncharacterized protein n=1 Tax=Psylliodes chrysocephalus TaxID=3402493 RepID=A0A9P0CXC3_9CUCU|nr:unnamed protein product [Psylliodes chrysocephala]
MSTTPSLQHLFNLIQSGHADLKTETNSFKTSIESKISHLVDDIKDLRKENTECKQRILESERKLKKFNLIVYGVQGVETDTTDELLKVIGDYLHITCNKQQFRDVFRFGRQVEGKIRPILFEVVNYELKTQILNAARLINEDLRKIKVLFLNDYAKEDYIKRKFLHGQLKEAKTIHPQAKIKKKSFIFK